MLAYNYCITKNSTFINSQSDRLCQRVYTGVKGTSQFFTTLFFDNFRKGIQMAHWGACTNLTQIESCGHVKERCPDDEASDVPVCGSNGNVYRFGESRPPLINPQSNKSLFL
jgi:hypothetical protein